MARLDDLFLEVEEVLQSHQTELSATLQRDHIAVAGTFVCMSDDGPFDRFEVEMVVSSLFPQKEPSLHEVGGRIPRTVKRHVFPTSGRCCLGLWEAWLLKADVANFESYLSGPVTSYFVSQSIYEITGEWPFGEQGHGADEIAATYAEALELPAGADQKEFLRLLALPLLTGNPRCPCGGGERLRKCHWGSIRERRRRIPAFVRKDLFQRLGRASKE